MKPSLALLVLGEVVFFSSWAHAAAKRPMNPTASVDGKKVIELAQVEDVQIEMPDGNFQSFGEDFQSRLMTDLAQSSQFLVSMPDAISQAPMRAQMQIGKDDQHYLWSGSVTPSAVLKVEVRALTFQTGARGDRMFYGFDEHFRTSFNSGDQKIKNEFPLQMSGEEPSWFGSSFADQGQDPLNRRSGLDLGDGFSINFLFAWLTVKYAEYHSALRLRLHLDFPVSPSGGGATREFHDISVQGKGFYYDAVGAYSGYSVGIMAARKDAILQAVNRSITGSFSALEQILSSVPLVARVDAIVLDGTVLLGTGPNSQVRAGVFYALVDHPQVVLRVTASRECGSEAQVVAGDASLVIQGALVRQVESIAAAKESGSRLAALSLDPSVPSSVNSIQLPSQNFAQIELPPIENPGQWQPVLTKTQAFAKSLTDMIFLPYRIYRYFAYDQNYHRNPYIGSRELSGGATSWGRQIGLDRAPAMKAGNPVVAVIDSGVDYNHPVLHSSLWLNPSPWSLDQTDPDRYGWDFISNDSHPYDDHAHGTHLASMVVSVAPQAKIMALKVFNPWGITTSASLLAAFHYAVDHGAQVILCGWSTSVNSQALKEGVEYAKLKGVPVVVSAGDGGWDLTHVWAFPGAYAAEVNQVLVVTGVDSRDRIVQGGRQAANYGKNDVQIAAPGEDLMVAEPRGGRAVGTSADLAAAIVAGALARVAADQGFQGGGRAWIETLLKDADVVPQLENYVHGGLRLRIRR